MPLVPHMTHQDIVTYLRRELLPSVRGDIFPLLRTRHGAPFATVRLVLCYCDYLGALYSGYRRRKGGRPSQIAMSKKALRFIRDILGQIDPLYRLRGKLLYDIYRHGTVHLYAPKHYRNRKGRHLLWYIVKARSPWSHSGIGTMHHLRITRVSPGQRSAFPVSLFRLFFDLRRAIQRFAHLITQEQQSGGSRLRNRWVSTANEICKPTIRRW